MVTSVTIPINIFTCFIGLCVEGSFFNISSLEPTMSSTCETPEGPKQLVHPLSSARPKQRRGPRSHHKYLIHVTSYSQKIKIKKILDACTCICMHGFTYLSKQYLYTKTHSSICAYTNVCIYISLYVCIFCQFDDLRKQNS